MKKKDHKILLLAGVGVGAYLLYRNASAGSSSLVSSGVTASLPAPGVTTTAAAQTTLTSGQVQNGISQAYANDAQNQQKINAWIAGEPNQSVQTQARAWIATTDINQRSFLANYYDYIKSGYNHDILLAGTIPFMTAVDKVKGSTGFHL